MDELNETQKKILKCFYDLQCGEDDGEYNDDETPCIRYSDLEEELKTTRPRIKPDLLEIRNAGLIHILPTVDCDYQPSGSGYFLTEKGAALAKKLFFIF